MSRRTIAIISLILVATGLRIWQLSTQSIWFDEGFSWHAASQPTLLETLNGDPTNPPLYYLLLHIWIRLVGDSEFGLRSLSLLQGIVLLAGMAAVAQRWSGSRAALLATAIGAFTPLLWWASQEARMYNTLALAVLLMTTGLMALHAGHLTRNTWAAVIAGEMAALYVHNTGVVVLGAANAVTAISWLANAIRREPDWRLLRNWTVAQAAVVLVWLPELLARFRNLGGANTTTRTPPELSPALVWQSWQAVWASSWEMVLDSPIRLTAVSLGLLMVLLTPGLWALRQRHGRLFWGTAGLLYIILLVALSVLGVNFHGRYIVMLTPLLIIGIAVGIAGLPRRVDAFASVLAVAAVAFTWCLLPGNPLPAYQHDQAREIIRYYASELTAGDLILTWSYAKRYELHYYAAREGLQARIITIPDGSDQHTAADIINAALSQDLPVRVEINTWYTQASDRRGMLPCLVGHDNPAPFATFTVQGMTTTAFRLDAPIAIPDLQPVNAPFVSAELTAIGLPKHALVADHGICVPIQVTLTAPTTGALNTAVNLRNRLGWEVAGADSPLLTDIQETTTHLQAGASIRAFPLIYLPQGAPPGEYPLHIRLYTAAQPSGLDVLDPVSGAPTGKDISPGSLVFTRGQWPSFTTECVTPVASGLLLTNCATLLPDTFIAAGSPLSLTLAWQVEVPPQAPVTLTLAGSNWAVEDSIQLNDIGAVLDWRALLIPADASGNATLSAHVNGYPEVVLGQVQIESAIHQLTPPPVAMHSGVRFTEGGTLLGFSPVLTNLPGGKPFTVTLVWASEGPTSQPYQVTVQLLSADGTLLAQHDGPPAAGARPTTGWINGEYITDTHELFFREELSGYTGPATLIVALYSPGSGQRLLTESGSNFAVLFSDLTVVEP